VPNVVCFVLAVVGVAALRAAAVGEQERERERVSKTRQHVLWVGGLGGREAVGFFELQ
jgi:hypothetical protein